MLGFFPTLILRAFAPFTSALSPLPSTLLESEARRVALRSRQLTSHPNSLAAVLPTFTTQLLYFFAQVNVLLLLGKRKRKKEVRVESREMERLCRSDSRHLALSFLRVSDLFLASLRKSLYLATVFYFPFVVFLSVLLAPFLFSSLGFHRKSITTFLPWCFLGLDLPFHEFPFPARVRKFLNFYWRTVIF